MDLACVCDKLGFVFLAAVERANSKICSATDQKSEVPFCLVVLNSRFTRHVFIWLNGYTFGFVRTCLIY